MPFDFSAYKPVLLDTVELVTKQEALIDVLEDAFNNSIAANAVTTAISWTASDYHTKTQVGDTTYTFSNVPATGVAMILFRLTVTSGTPTWPAAVIWEEGITPTFTAGKTHLIMFITENGGTTVRASACLNFAS